MSKMPKQGQQPNKTKTNHSNNTRSKSRLSQLFCRSIGTSAKANSGTTATDIDTRDAGDHQLLYPSSLDDAVDDEILELWNKFLRGETQHWKQIVAEHHQDHPSNEYHYERILNPGVYWSDHFKNGMVSNIAGAYPCVAMALLDKPLKHSAMVVCSIMEIILKSVITEQPNSTVSILYPDDDDDDEPSRYFNPVQQAQVNTVKQVIGPERLKRIVRAHIAWDISDAAFITVENSLMQAMRTCLGSEFKPEYEVRLRYKYAMVKTTLQHEQEKFVQQHPVQAQEWFREGSAQKAKLQKQLDEQQEPQQQQQQQQQDDASSSFNGDEDNGDNKTNKMDQRPSLKVDLVSCSMIHLPDEYNPTRPQ